MPLAKDADPEALRRFREARGLTHEEVAELAWATPLEVAVWEDGTVRVPRAQARRLRQRDAADRRAAAVAAAALPACAWADAHAPDLHDLLLAEPWDLDRLPASARAHLDDCAVCTRVLALGRGLVRIRPDPGLGADPLESLEHGYDTAPRWVLYSIVVVAGAALALGSVDRWNAPPDVPAGSVWDAPAAVLWGAVVFGLTATVLRRLLRRRPYLAGLLSAAPAMLVGMAAWMLAEPGANWFSGPALLGVLLVTIVVGVLAGRWNDRNPWDDTARAGRPDAGPERLAPPDPLQDAVAVPPLRAEPAPRSARPA